jgi:hypothetical protein
MPEIVIDLDGERDAYAVRKSEDLVHPMELEQLQTMLKKSVHSAKKYAREYDQDNDSKVMLRRRHDTIMLAGVRGCGKTTFMLSALNYIEKKLQGEEFVNGIESMGIIDPTLIEEKVHIFVNIISKVREVVNDKAKIQNCFLEDNETSRNYKKWEQSFRKLAEGLPSINGVGSDGFGDDAWLDSEFVMNKGVQRAHAANTLEKNFHDYIRNSLKFINKDAFILCFDDIDTHFEKGWPVLEVIHKYLTTPQFVTILSGDLQLYSYLIRQKQWDNFSDKILQMEARFRGERLPFKNTVAHLEEQYLLKILKPERRIFLSSLYQKAKDLDFPISVKKKDGSKEPLHEYYLNILKTQGITSSSQQQTCYRFLSSLPIRTQKQLLHAFDSSPDKIVHSILDVFWSDLSENNVEVSRLRNVPQYIVPDILTYLVKNSILNEGYTLVPVFSDQLVNGAQYALGSLISTRITKEPALIFDYWIRVALTRELGSIWGDNVDKGNKGPSIQDLIIQCSMEQGRSTRYVARLATSYIRAAHEKDVKGGYESNSWHGTLPLLGLATKDKGSSGYQDRIDAILDEINIQSPVVALIGRLPLSGATNHNGQTLPIYSFYNLLGVLGELVNATQGISREEAFNITFEILRKNAQFREYPIPKWASKVSEDSGDSNLEFIEDEQGEINRDDCTEFVEAFVDWVQATDQLVVSASVLGKMFTRFFYTMNDMDKTLPKETMLGEWMHRLVIAFLNSVLVVESLEQSISTNLSLSLLNPRTENTIFVNNLKKLNSKSDDLNADSIMCSKWILSCPIWQFFLKEEIIELTDFLKNTKKLSVTSGFLCEKLNKVAIKRKNPIKTPTVKFNLTSKSHIDTAKKVLSDNDLSPTHLESANINDLKDLFKKELATQFDMSRFSIRSVQGIIKRILQES